MKLIPLICFISITVDVKANEHFTFPPKFLSPNTGVMSTSDSSIYLSPESHTTIPYFSNKNENHLPYPYLPISGTKAPIKFPTPFPLMFSTTLIPIDHDDDDDDDKDKDGKQSPPFHRNNRTTRSRPEKVDKRDLTHKANYQPIDRIDTKLPYGFVNNNAPMHPNPAVQRATPRSFIISAEQQRNDALDQFRGAAAYQGPQYLPAPGISGVYVSSTTETAIPILRLSNEMDLDGSFSYEALGADQTHYVQHSRMENTGTDKEEQVVEGSYSYVGDNGQTYTVHYVADSKGFRASGDHLPVAPPVPEIIQRAIQFNLAEEAKKPPNHKSWHNNEEKENELSESEKYQRFSVPPPRPLFTGKAPQSFSFGFAQAPHSTQNNAVPAASTQNTINTNNDFTLEQMKGNPNNVGAISPQITFLASQGAHNPSVNAQQSISRAFTTERTILPQLVNYEAVAKESDHESNKGLWRWQYGLNANMNQTPDKNSISRSSGEGDNVIINFGDMTPNEYSKMIKSELEPNMQNAQNDQDAESSEVITTHQKPNNNIQHQNGILQDSHVTFTENVYISTQVPDNYKNDNQKSHQRNPLNQFDKKTQSRHTPEDTFTSRSKLITQSDFVPQSQTVTNSYDYEDSSYEPKRLVRTSTLPATSINSNYIKINNYEIGTSNEENQINKFSTPKQETLPNSFYTNMNNYEKSIYEPTWELGSSTSGPKMSPNTNYNNRNNYERGTQNTLWSNTYSNQIENIQKVLTTETPTTTMNNSIGFNDFIMNDNKNDFRPILPFETENKQEEPITSESKDEDIFEGNVFLKNFINSKKSEQNKENKIREENQNHHLQKINTERKPDKIPKLIQMQAKPHNDIKGITKKPMDMADIMNYISAKNHFESIKVKPKSKYGSNNYNHKSEIHFIPLKHVREHDNDHDEVENMELNTNNHRISYHPEELQGIIKNYKVLQRNNSAFNKGQDGEPRRDLSPPPVKMVQSNLPPLGRAGPFVKSYLPPIYV